MKSSKSIAIGVLLLTIIGWSVGVTFTPLFVIDSKTENEINNRLHVEGGMGGNITLVSSKRMAFGTTGFLLKGEVEGKYPVALKISNRLDREFRCYEKINAMSNRTCESYGITFIYYCGEFLHLKMLAMTLLEKDLDSLRKELGPFSRDTILIVARDLIKTLKFIHSGGVLHWDLKPENILIRGANVFLCGIKWGTSKRDAGYEDLESGERFYASVGQHLGKPPAEYDDLESLHYALLSIADVQLPWLNLTTRPEIGEKKLRTKQVEELCYQIKYPELVELCFKFYSEVREAIKQKRLPRYDYLYHMYDDALYAGRNRTERIVFEWLTPEQKATAMAEDVPSIESIVFPEEDEL